MNNNLLVFLAALKLEERQNSPPEGVKKKIYINILKSIYEDKDDLYRSNRISKEEK